MMEIISKLIANGEVRRAIFNTQKFFPGLWARLVQHYFLNYTVDAFYVPVGSRAYLDLTNLLLESEWMEEKSNENCKFYGRRIYVTETQKQQGFSATEHISNLVAVLTFEVAANAIAEVSWLRANYTEQYPFKRTETKRLYLQTGLYHGYEICYRFYHSIVAYPTLKYGENYIAPSEETVEIDYGEAALMDYEWIETETIC